MSLAHGTRLGAYEVLSLIGSGGMGEVYQARDTRLGRDVAIKVLPQDVAADPARISRFRREAQLLASLNHPNIASIYGFEEAQPFTSSGPSPSTSSGALALVLELVDGPTLADRIAYGPVPLDEALAIARQISDALEAAHEHGLVHRDLKPANIKVRPDGTVKILDFGLAKAVEQTPAGALSMSPTLTSPVGATMAGMILGTAAYMAPEQAKGRFVDKRADIWAFGVVLYEMLTGRRPFAAETVVETIGLVVAVEPDWTAVSPQVPPHVAELIRRCLT
jgi:serine/threonine-protein kinase